MLLSVLRKIPLLLVILYSSLLTATRQDYAIVFIHVGEEIPPYAQTALAQARLFNEHCPIILLGNEPALECFALDPALDITLISCESLTQSAYHKTFSKKTTLDKKSRSGFWLYTTERFLYLDDLITQYNLHNVFHLEYDNMLYANLEELLPVFTDQYPGIAATFDNDDRCIAGLIYIANPTAMNTLGRFFANRAKANLNDMQILALFRKDQPASTIDFLPILTKEYAETKTLISPYGHTVADKSRYFHNIDLFQSIFDAAALGQFLGGIDPRNGDSSPGFINESCIFNPSLLNIVWEPDDLGRKIPYVVYPHMRYRINNLHIHSKNLTAFSSTNL